MKTGRSLQDLAREIERQAATKKDYKVSADAISVYSSTREAGRISDSANGHTEMQLGTNNPLVVNDIAHQQLASKLEIPKAYYDRMRKESPRLLDENVNHWLRKPLVDDRGRRETHPKFFVRTLDNEVRALLSDRYKPLDNAECAEAILPILLELDLLILSCEITPRNMLIKAVDKRIERDIPKGSKMGSGHTIFDTLAPAITIGNSEVGFGTLYAKASVYTRQCTNMATFNENSVRKYHIGARLGDGDASFELMSDKTRRVTDAATFMQLADVVRGAFNQTQFDALADKLAETAGHKIEGDPVKVVEITAKKFGISDSEKSSVLKHLIEGADLSRYGLFNAITRTAEDLESYDRATEFENLGGKIIELPKSDWKAIAAAM